MIQVVREEPVDQSSMKMSVWVETDPPNMFTFDHSAIFDVFVNSANSVSSFVAIIQESNVVASIDVAFNRSHLSSLRFPHTSNEVVLRSIRERPMEHREVSESVADKINNALLIGEDVNHNEIFGYSNAEEKFEVEFKIKVIAFKRVASLSRLLNSLAAANYLNYTVSLDIFVDGYDKEEVIYIQCSLITILYLFVGCSVGSCFLSAGRSISLAFWSKECHITR